VASGDGRWLWWGQAGELPGSAGGLEDYLVALSDFRGSWVTLGSLMALRVPGGLEDRWWL
jgi:hypothetical protein